MDLGHGQIGSAHQTDQHVVGFAQDLPAIEHRMGQQFLDHFAGAGWSHALGDGEKAFGVAGAKHGAELGQMDVNQTTVPQQAPDAAHAVGQQFVGQLKSFQHAGVFINQPEDFLVGQTDDAIGSGLELFQAALGQVEAAAAFAFEGQRHKSHHQRARCLGRLRQGRTETGAGPAAEARDDENHICAFAGRFELGELFVLGASALRNLFPTCRESAQEASFQMNFFQGRRSR